MRDGAGGPNCHQVCLCKRKEGGGGADPERKMHPGEAAWPQSGGWREAATNPETLGPRGAGRGRRDPPWGLRGSSLPHLWPQNWEGLHFSVLSHPAGGHLRPPQDTDTLSSGPCDP